MWRGGEGWGRSVRGSVDRKGEEGEDSSRGDVNNVGVMLGREKGEEGREGGEES